MSKMPATTPARVFLVRWLINAVAVFVATQIVPGIECPTWDGLLVATLLLGLLNVFVRPLLLFLSLPLVVFSLGLFLWVINAALLSFVAWLVKPFEVHGFGTAMIGAAVISVISILLGGVFGANPSPGMRVRKRRSSIRRQKSIRSDRTKETGPVIDV